MADAGASRRQARIGNSARIAGAAAKH